MLNLINNEPDTDKIYLYAKDLFEPKYQLLINQREGTDLKYLNNSKACIVSSNDMDDIYKNIEEFNPNKKQKILLAFDDIITDMLSNKDLNPLGTELFVRGRGPNIPLVLIAQFYFAVPKSIRLNSTQKRELQQVINYSSDIGFQDFMNLHKNVLQNHIHFLLLTLYSSIR